MKDNNIHFVGYYHGIEAKMKYVDLFDCKNKFFLESSQEKYKDSDAKNIQYLPEQIYKVNIRIKDFFIKKEIIVDTLLKKIYQRDFKHFKALKFEIKKISYIKKILLFLFFFLTYFLKSHKGLTRFNPLTWILELRKTISAYHANNDQILNKFKYFIFRINFLLGYKYCTNLLDNRLYNKNDIYILWGKSYSSRILLISYLEKLQIPFFISEYGEVPGTISCSPHGIFGEMFSKSSWTELYKKEITENDIVQTKHILETVQENQISTRTYDNNMYFLMKYFFDSSVKKEDRKKIIYVNGAELFSAGLYWNRWNIGNQGRNPNKMLLEKVVSFFNKNEYMIIYKEHPMTVIQSQNDLLQPANFPTVNFVESMNIHDLMDMSDIIISFPSKVVMTSLLYNKTTFVLGDFTMPESIPIMKYFTSRNFNDIKEILSQENSTNQEYIEIVAKLIKYFLIIYDQKLHTHSTVEDQQQKLKHVLENK